MQEGEEEVAGVITVIEAGEPQIGVQNGGAADRDQAQILRSNDDYFLGRQEEANGPNRSGAQFASIPVSSAIPMSTNIVVTAVSSATLNTTSTVTKSTPQRLITSATLAPSVWKWSQMNSRVQFSSDFGQFLSSNRDAEVNWVGPGAQGLPLVEGHQINAGTSSSAGHQVYCGTVPKVTGSTSSETNVVIVDDELPSETVSEQILDSKKVLKPPESDEWGYRVKGLPVKNRGQQKEKLEVGDQTKGSKLPESYT